MTARPMSARAHTSLSSADEDDTLAALAQLTERWRVEGREAWAAADGMLARAMRATIVFVRSLDKEQ